MADSGLRERIHRALAARAGVDTRALAMLRVSIGLLLLADLLLRARDLLAHYTDYGVLPRSLLASGWGSLQYLSFHTLSGGVWTQAVLFSLAGVAAVALAVGYRTRSATAVSWLLLVSLHARNPLLLNAGDSLLRRLLFWGLFLPLGARWSIDAVSRTPRTPRRVVSIASGVLLAQVVVIYIVNAVVKFRADVWPSGQAMLYVFSIDRLTVRFGDLLAGYPDLLVALGYFWLGLLVASPLLLLLTGWPRAILAGTFAGMHFGMFLTMRLGIFPLVSMAALVPFLPPAIWDRVEWVSSSSGVRDRLYGPARGVARVLPTGPLVTAHRRAVVGRAAKGIVAVLAALLLVWNAASLGIVTVDNGQSPVDPAEHRWDMFAPSPPQSDTWYVVNATTETGIQIDPLQRGPVEWNRPSEPASRYPTQRWDRYLWDLQRGRYSWLRPAFGDYLCRRWNTTHDDDIVRMTVTLLEQPTRLDRPDPLQRRILLEHECG